MWQKHQKAALAIIVVVAILLVFALAGSSFSSRGRGYLEGVWTGDPSFLRSAAASDFMLFLGPAANGTHQGYLRIVGENGETVTSQALSLTVSAGPRLWWPAIRAAFARRRDVLTLRATLELDEASGSVPPLPPSFSLSVSVLEGTLALFDSTKVYAFLEKDLLASSVALQAYEQA